MSQAVREFNHGNTRVRGYCHIFFFILFFAAQVSVQAQWKPVLSLYPYNALKNTVYFLDVPGPPRIGFVSQAANRSLLMKTTDGGDTWYDVKFFPIPPDGALSEGMILVSDIFFQDSLHGWLAAGVDGIYKTTDAGETWGSVGERWLNGGPVPYSIYYDTVSHGLFIAAPHVIGGKSVAAVFSSFDEGNTFALAADTKDSGDYGAGFAFTSDSLGIGAGYLRTTDAGVTWSQLPIGRATNWTFWSAGAFWQPLPLRGSNTFFGLTYVSSTVYRITDSGNTWTDITSFPNDSLSSGSIRGDSCHLIIQLRSGAYLSENHGSTWLWLQGPPHAREDWVARQRFYYKDHIIYMRTNLDRLDTYARPMLWKLDLDSLPASILGFSGRFDDGSRLTLSHPGNSVGYTLVPGAGTLTPTDSVTLSLRWNADALGLSSLTIPAGWRISDSSSIVQPSHYTTLTLTLRSDSAESLPSPLLHATFETYLTPSERRKEGYSTFICLDSVHSFFTVTTSCAATSLSLSQPDSVEIDFSGCGDSVLADFMETGEVPLTIESVTPNPARDEVVVGYWVSGLGSRVGIEMYDQLGRVVLSQEFAAPEGDAGRAALQVGSLPSGIYYLRVASGGFSASRRVAVER